MEEKEREIWIGESRYYLGEDDITYMIMVGDVNDDLMDAFRDAGDKVLNMGAGPVNALIDLTRSGKISPEARKLFNGFGEHEKMGKIAIFGMNPVARVIGSFFIGTSKKKDMRFFSSKEDALAWLKE